MTLPNLSKLCFFIQNSKKTICLLKIEFFGRHKTSFGGLREGKGGALPFSGKREPETDPKGHAQIKKVIFVDIFEQKRLICVIFAALFKKIQC